MSALVGRCTILTGLVIYPIYDYLGIDLDKSIYSQIYGDGESDTPVPVIRHVHTFQINLTLPDSIRNHLLRHQVRKSGV
jgi:hypothetical protein